MKELHINLHIISETRSGSSCLKKYSNNGYKIIEEHEWKIDGILGMDTKKLFLKLRKYLRDRNLN